MKGEYCMILTYADGHAKAVMCDQCLQICAPCFDCNAAIPTTQIIIDNLGNLHRTYNNVHTDGSKHICHECYSATQYMRKHIPTDVSHG